MDALARGAMRVLHLMMVACLAVMVVMVFGNVVLRYGFNSGIAVSEEGARYLFVWLIFIGSVVAMYEHSHLGVDTLVKRLPPSGKKVCAVLSDLLMLGCCGLLVLGGWKQTVFNMGNAAPVSGLPIGVMHAAEVVSSIGMGIVILSHLLRTLSGRLSADELIQVADSEERMPEVAVKGAPQ